MKFIVTYTSFIAQFLDFEYTVFSSPIGKIEQLAHKSQLFYDPRNPDFWSTCAKIWSRDDT